MAKAKLSPQQAAGLVAISPFLAFVFWCYRNPGLFSKLWIVVQHNPGFWLLMATGVVVALWRRKSNPQEMMWVEVPVLISTFWLVALATFSYFFFSATDLGKTEAINGKVTKAEYHEEYTTTTTEECGCSTDEDGVETCTSTCDVDTYHPPTWTVSLDGYNGEKGANIHDQSITPEQFENIADAFGNRQFVALAHVNQTSIGDGDMYVTTYKPQSSELIPSSWGHDYVNYVAGSKQTILRQRSGDVVKFQSLLKPHPVVHGGDYGKIEMDRVIDAQAGIPSAWSKVVDRTLDEALVTLGPEKQANILIYVVGTEDRNFRYALDGDWDEKNDIVVIIGTSGFPEVAWVEVLAWTNVEMFKIGLRDDLEQLGTLDDPFAVTGLIIDWVRKPPEEGGFERLAMEFYEFLASDILLPWWAQFIIWFLTLLFSVPMIWALENNKIREFVSRRLNY
jgi:hypothetical protein